MDTPVLVKARAGWRVPSNLRDSPEARARFSWEAAGRALAGLPGGRGLNIAHVLLVDGGGFLQCIIELDRALGVSIPEADDGQLATLDGAVDDLERRMAAPG